MDGLNKVPNFVYTLCNWSVVAPTAESSETNHSQPPVSAVCTEASTPRFSATDLPRRGRSVAGEFLHLL